jgi:hypothetical protein
MDLYQFGLFLAGVQLTLPATRSVVVATRQRMPLLKFGVGVSWVYLQQMAINTLNSMRM